MGVHLGVPKIPFERRMNKQSKLKIHTHQEQDTMQAMNGQREQVVIVMAIQTHSMRVARNTIGKLVHLEIEEIYFAHSNACKWTVSQAGLQLNFIR